MEKFNLSIKRIVLYSIMLAGLYILSILLRVSIAEKDHFGRSDLIPLSLSPPKYKQQSIPESYGQATLTVVSEDGQSIQVWRQKVNGFQHVYGSALVALELGETASDKIFCANEWAEALLDPNGISEQDFKDRRKDLYHNKLGRQIANYVKNDFKNKGVTGEEADKKMQDIILNLMEMEQSGGLLKVKFTPVLNHYKDSRYNEWIQTEAELNCDHLPNQSLIQWLKVDAEYNFLKAIKHKIEEL